MTNLELISLGQRILGSAALFFLAFQIFMGATGIFFKIHRINGVVTYLLVFIHILLLVVKNYLIYSKLDPFYVFIDACVICDGKYEYYINLGRFAFYLLTLTVLSARLKYFVNFFKSYWRKFHYLNYLVFILVSIHAILIGSDTTKLWFLFLFTASQMLFVYSVYRRLRSWLCKVWEYPLSIFLGDRC